MRITVLVTILLFAFALLFSSISFSQDHNAATATDGKIIEQAVFALPTYEQIPDPFKTVYSRSVVDQIRNSTELELLKIKYLSDGLKISGFIYKPKNTAGKKLPAVIWNHGMVTETSKIGVENYNDI